MKHPAIWESFRTLRQLDKMLPKISTSSDDNVAPLSYAQERLWLLTQLNPEGSVFNIPYALHLQGDLDVDALTASVGEIIQRHDALRTVFKREGSETIQVISPIDEYSIPFVNIPEGHGGVSSEQVIALVGAEASMPFCMEKGPLFRTKLLQLGPSEYILLLTFHHIVFDAWSDGVFFKELNTLYSAYSKGDKPSLPKLGVQYADYSRWQGTWKETGFIDAQLEYWRAQLEGITPQKFPIDHANQPLNSNVPGRHFVVFPDEFTESIKGLADDEGITDFVVFLTAFSVLLSRYLKKDDVYVCSPIATRGRRDVQPLIGYLVNFIVYRIKLSSDLTFKALLDRVCHVSSGAYSHQEMPIQELVKDLDLYDINFSKLIFSFQNATRQAPNFDGLNVSELDEQRGTDFEMFFELENVDEGLSLNLRYDPALFDAETIEQLVNDFVHILSSAIQDPEIKVAALLPLSVEREAALQHKLELAEQQSSVSETQFVAPRNELEEKMTSLWLNLLKLERIGVKDNFFAIGGKSLNALQLVALIEAEFGKKILVSQMAQAATIEEMVNLLNEGCDADNVGLVELQPHGDKPPLFLVQPSACTALHFAELARQLSPDQPVYGFEQKGMSGDEPHKSVEEMAAFYIKQMKKVAPSGPYLLLGRCMGGIVAYEMALQLRSRGEVVAMVGILDTQSPPRLQARSYYYYASELVKRIFHYVRRGKFLKVFLGMYMSRSKRRHSQEPLERITQHVMDTHVIARRRYIPSSIYQGSLQVFKNKEGSLDAQDGWTVLATEGLDIIETSGDHSTMLEAEHIGEFVEQLKEVMQVSINKVNAHEK